MKNKLMLVMPMVLLLTLTSCGGESFTEVTDETKKSDTLKAAQQLNDKPTETVLGLKATSEASYDNGSKKTSVNTVTAAAFSGNYLNVYSELKDSSNNYAKSYIYFDTSDSAFYQIYDASFKSENTTITANCSYKFASTSADATDHTATTDSDKSKKVMASISVEGIGSITISSDVKIYTGSKGSVKVEVNSNSAYHCLIVSSTGLLTYTETSVTDSSSSVATTLKNKETIEYNVSSIPSLKKGDYKECDLLDYGKNALAYTSISGLILAGVGVAD